MNRLRRSASTLITGTINWAMLSGYDSDDDCTPPMVPVDDNRGSRTAFSGDRPAAIRSVPVSTAAAAPPAALPAAPPVALSVASDALPTGDVIDLT